MELDQHRNEPWGNESKDVLNEHEFVPDVPLPVNDVTDELLSSFNPLLHPHMRTGEALRSKWDFLRYRFTVCTRNYEKYGQGGRDVFPDFTYGQKILYYIRYLYKTSSDL